jgi:putative membrane protein
MSADTRKPRVFEPDDPAIVAEPAPSEQPNGTERPPPELPLARPTLAQMGERGLRWGVLLASALAGAACLGAAAWFARLVSAALLRDDWWGWTVLALLLVAAFAATMILMRELIGYSRLARLNHLKTEIGRALNERDQKRERKVANRLADFYSSRAELAWSVSRFRSHANDVHDAGELLALADREILAPIDLEARRMVTRSSKRVATVTALSPMMLIAVTYVLFENLRLLRALASLYGGRPGFVGGLRLAQLVFAHVVATGGVAMTDDMLGQFLGQDILRRLSRRLGEGAFNGALTARVGVAAIEVVRPLPFLSTKAPRVRDVLGEALKPLISGKKT